MGSAKCRSDRSPPSALVPLTVQLFVLQFRRTLLAGLLVLLAVGLLAVDTAVLDEAAGRAFPELDDVAPVLATVGAGYNAIIRDGHGAHQRYNRGWWGWGLGCGRV